jgi:hypothetical protein
VRHRCGRMEKIFSHLAPHSCSSWASSVCP